MPATAVYFEEVTKNVQMMRLESKVIQQRNIAQNLESYTSMMSHEFRTPLGTSIMFIEMILGMQTNAAAIRMIKLVKVSLSLLLSLVNDMVDLKLIKANQFTINTNIFSPLEAIRFVKEIFDHSAQGNNLQLTIKTV